MTVGWKPVTQKIKKFIRLATRGHDGIFSSTNRQRESNDNISRRDDGIPFVYEGTCKRKNARINE